MDFKRVKEVLFHQHKFGYGIGALIAMWGGTQVYQGLINSYMLAHTYYHTTGQYFLKELIPWINFPLFFLFGVLVVLLIMLLHFKFLMWGIVAFSVQQSYKHDNPMEKDLKRILANQADLLKRIKAIEGNLPMSQGGR